MNKVTLIGRLTRDPDIRYSQNSDQPMAVARYTLAVDRRFRREGSEQNADFISCVAFGRQAEFAEKYLHQGMKIAVNGRIQTGSYTNREGQKVYTTDVVIEDHEFVEGRNASAGQSSGGASYSNNNYNNNTAPQPAAAAGDGFMNIPDGIDEELPFN
jgi:single-strand DNA-binding protein